jgi:hypothetical protein
MTNGAPGINSVEQHPTARVGRDGRGAMELKEVQHSEPVKENKSMTVKSTHSMSMLGGSPRSKKSCGGNQFW